MNEFFHMFSPDVLTSELSAFVDPATASATWFALLNIIMIDLVMSGDNAILIGMATKNLPAEQRKKAILWGVTGAAILRILFSMGVVILLQIP